MDQTVRFQEALRRLAMIDEAFVEDEARLGLDPAGTSALDPAYGKHLDMHQQPARARRWER